MGAQSMTRHKTHNMHGFIVACTLLGTMLLASPAKAAKDFSYAKSLGQLIETRSILMNYCRSFKGFGPVETALIERDGLGRVCGDYWNGKDINGATIRYIFERDEEKMTTLDAWVFKLPSERYTDGFWLAVLVEPIIHKDNTFNQADPRKPFMDVILYKREDDPEPIRFTNGEAWEGYSMKTRTYQKTPNEPPSGAAMEKNIWELIHRVRMLRFDAREAYRDF